MASQPPERAAVVIIHGIGEQPPISTLGRFAQGLMDHAGVAEPEPVLRQIAGLTVPIVRFRDLIEDGETDVMEYAWQHLVRGQISASATLGWLLATTLAPLDFGRHWRILAAAGADAPAPWQLVVRQLLIALALLMPLLLLVAFALLVMQRWLEGGFLPVVPQAVTLTAGEIALFVLSLLMIMTGLLQLFAILRAAISVSRVRRRSVRLHDREWSGLHGHAISQWRWPALLLAVLVIAGAAGVAMLAADAYRIIPVWLADPAGRRWLLFVLAAAGMLLLIPLFLRWLRDYAGDIAYYVTSDRQPVARRSRYDIRRNAAQFLNALLHDPNYSRIVVVGHSLGSVIAFDALNELSREVRRENVPGAALVGKLTGLLTFASPLDKVAYFFRESTADDAAVHAQMLSYLHPTKRLPSRRDDGPYRLQHYNVPFHRLRWINLHAPIDVISDPLVFYGVDKLCRLNYWPWGAHSRYWRDARTYQGLVELLESWP